MQSRSVILPLLVAFVVYWLGSIDLPKAAARYKAVEPVKAKS